MIGTGDRDTLVIGTACKRAAAAAAAAVCGCCCCCCSRRFWRWGREGGGVALVFG